MYYYPYFSGENTEVQKSLSNKTHNTWFKPWIIIKLMKQKQPWQTQITLVMEILTSGYGAFAACKHETNYFLLIPSINTFNISLMWG